jgi:hypothetical protein
MAAAGTTQRWTGGLAVWPTPPQQGRARAARGKRDTVASPLRLAAHPLAERGQAEWRCGKNAEEHSWRGGGRIAGAAVVLSKPLHPPAATNQLRPDKDPGRTRGEGREGRRGRVKGAERRKSMFMTSDSHRNERVAMPPPDLRLLACRACRNLTCHSIILTCSLTSCRITQHHNVSPTFTLLT